MEYNILKKLRKKYNLTQADMARLLGLKYRSHYNQIENGKIVLTLDMAFKIADIFNMNVEEIFFTPKVHDTKTFHSA